MANIAGVLFLVFVAVVAAHTKKEWANHSIIVSKFACVPRPRNFRLSEVLEGYKDSGKLTPMSTVLHRCDRFSGSCQVNKECTVHPRGRQLVDLPFFSISIGQIVLFKAENHTLCECDTPDTNDIKK